MSSERDDLVHVDFEVFGRVQGVFFRMHTQKQGQVLGVRGFCRNTRSGSVSGAVEGPLDKVQQMLGVVYDYRKKWLGTVGSPHSRIEKVEFTGEVYIKKYSFDGPFGIEGTI